MNNLWNVVFVVLILGLLERGFVGKIDWSINIPIVLLLIVIWLVSMYNSFVSMSHRVKEAWSDIEVQLKRRYDLIPNLVNTIKGCAAPSLGFIFAASRVRRHKVEKIQKMS